MYCKKCGCRVEKGEERCSNCGHDVSNIEFCGGFWGLVGEEKEENLHLQSTYDTVNKVKFHSEIGEKKPQGIKILVSMFVVALAFCVIQTVRVSSEHNKYATEHKKYQQTEKKYKKLEMEYEDLKEEYEDLEKKYDEEEETSVKQQFPSSDRIMDSETDVDEGNIIDDDGDYGTNRLNDSLRRGTDIDAP